MGGKWGLWFIGVGAILDFECIWFTLLVQGKDMAVDNITNSIKSSYSIMTTETSKKDWLNYCGVLQNK